MMAIQGKYDGTLGEKLSCFNSEYQNYAIIFLLIFCTLSFHYKYLYGHCTEIFTIYDPLSNKGEKTAFHLKVLYLNL
jgi:hypothetical protein